MPSCGVCLSVCLTFVNAVKTNKYTVSQKVVQTHGDNFVNYCADFLNYFTAAKKSYFPTKRIWHFLPYLVDWTVYLLCLVVCCFHIAAIWRIKLYILSGEPTSDLAAKQHYSVIGLVKLTVTIVYLDSDEKGNWNDWHDKSADVRLGDMSEDFDDSQRNNKIPQWTVYFQPKLERYLQSRRNKINRRFMT